MLSNRPRVRRDLDIGQRRNNARVLNMSPRQSAISQLGWGGPHRAGRHQPGGSAISSSGCRSCRRMEGFQIRRWDIVFPGCGEISTLPQFSPRAGSMGQSVSDQRMGVGFLHRSGRYRPEGSSFSSPSCWSCRCMDEFLIRGWYLILPGCGGTSMSARGETQPA